jgi:hypothetical protein
MMEIVSLHSQKGGTGKTSLALGLAVEAMRIGKKPLLMDLDFSGTSLRDIVHLKQGEKINTIEDYFLDPRNNSINDYISLAEITDLRTSSKIDISVMLDDSADLKRMMTFVYKENHSTYLESRLEGIIDTLAKAKQIGVIIVDNSPGAWGLSNSVLNIVRRGHIRSNNEIKFNGHSLLVSSSDLNDVMSCVGLQANGGSEHKSYKYVVNRSPYTNDVAKNITEITSRIDQKAEHTNNEGYKAISQELRAKTVNIQYAFPEDASMQQVFRNHFQGFPKSQLIQIQAFAKGVLGWR